MSECAVVVIQCAQFVSNIVYYVVYLCSLWPMAVFHVSCFMLSVFRLSAIHHWS